MTQDRSPILQLRGSSDSELAREEGGTAACSLPPGPAVRRLASTGPYSPPGEHTKTSLSSMGVAHQREGKRGRAREEGGMARREEGRRRGRGPRLWHTSGPWRVGREDC